MSIKWRPILVLEALAACSGEFPQSLDTSSGQSDLIGEVGLGQAPLKTTTGIVAFGGKPIMDTAEPSPVNGFIDDWLTIRAVTDT
ncbi:hypothetical protein [Celeribacter arenosi]|uniref:Uncharacterized protein n=1 Tax=Celeribacter arenosi TaxID=792649 RepID=A0ABP7K8T7_9RHOB